MIGSVREEMKAFVGMTIGHPQNDGRFRYRERWIGQNVPAMRDVEGAVPYKYDATFCFLNQRGSFSNALPREEHSGA